MPQARRQEATVESLRGTNAKDSESFPSPTQLEDTDGDGNIDCQDLNDDDDTIPDVVEMRCGYDPKSGIVTNGCIVQSSMRAAW